MEQIPNIVLILIMLLMTLMLVHGIITRRKKEQLERLYQEKESEFEMLEEKEPIRSIEQIEKTYKGQIAELKENNRRLMLEYEEKIEILTAKYKREIANLKKQINLI